MKIILTFAALFIISRVVFMQNKEVSHDLFGNVLKDNVKNGLVNYQNLQSDKKLDEYIDYISKINPSEIVKESDRLAFWINAYNAFTLKIIVDNYPVESINDLNSGGRAIAHVLGTTVWDKDLVTINNEPTNLNYIEHDVIRKEFSEPRIHFALVCAAVSCPPLRNEAYEGYKLNEQLENQAGIFFNDESKNSFDIKTRTAYLSKILDWYDDDFGDSDKEILLYVSQFLDKNLSESIKNNVDDWNIEYNDYNWDLNEIKN